MGRWRRAASPSRASRSELNHAQRPALLVGRALDVALRGGTRGMPGALLDDARVHTAAGELPHEPPPAGVRRRPDDAGGGVDREEEVRDGVRADVVCSPIGLDREPGS